MRKNGQLTYPHGDHLGSTVRTTRAGCCLPTDRTLTGQVQDGSGLVYMNARCYDPQSGQFISPDTVVPDAGSLFDYNRYMYARGNPLKYSDPSGHYSVDELMQHFGVDSFDALMALFGEGGAYAGNAGWYDILRAAQDGDSITATYADHRTSLQGTFTRNSQGQIFINMNGAMVPEIGFARLGGYVADGRKMGMPSDYGMYHLAGKYGERWATPVSGTQLMGDIGCNTWDCVALGLDATSLGATLFRDSALFSTPVTGPLGLAGGTYGEVVANSADLAGLTRSFQQHAAGKASSIDLSVSVVLYGAGRIPGVGVFAGVTQLGYDLASPFLPW